MSRILKRTSFGLLRTNPKLTTNVKIVADSKDHVYLESIDADPLLTKSIYKGFEVTGGSYSRDLTRFFSQGSQLLPKSIAYFVFEKDESVEIKDRYKDQYDFLYETGMQPKNSKIYTEEFSIFSPLWIEPGNEPDYFLIFKMDGPSTLDYNEYLKNNPGTNLDNDPTLDHLVTSPENFFNNFIDKAKIIKTFDLTKNSSIGRYIRNHSEDPLFPESSIYASLSKGELTYWQGISYDEGGFSKKAQDIYSDYVLIDKTIMENDDFITMGFYNNSVVHPNILNLEFLFDDVEQKDYEFSRYFGLYVSEAELGKFEIDGNRLFKDREVEYSQTPSPIKNVFGYANNIVDQIQSNDRGIKIYPKLNLGGTGLYEGRLIEWSETQNPRFPYVKSTKGNFYSINSSIGWTSTYMIGATSFIDDNRFLRIKNGSVNWKDFSGFKDPFTYIESRITDKRGRPNFTFSVIGNLSTGDQIRVGYTDWNDPNLASLIDYHTIIADPSIPAGKAVGLLFSTLGTKDQIALSISTAINNIQEVTNEHQIFSAISIANRVIVFSRLDSENWDKLRYSLFSTSIDFPFSKPNEFQPIQTTAYLPSPIAFTTPVIGDYFEYKFTGGCNNPNARFIINKEDFQEFVDEEDPVYLNTSGGYDLIGEYSIYLDEPILNSVGRIVDFKDFDKYIVYHINNTKNDIKFNSSKKLALYKTAKNSLGYLTIFPIRDFDFDSYDTTYMKDADSSYTELSDWYKGETGPNGSTPNFIYNDLVANSRLYIDGIIGPTSPFSVSGGFQSLNGISDDFLDENSKVTNEYDRLKENMLPELALSSKVVPFINKWVYDNESTDVRENPYRLNTDQSFGYSNFSPSFDELERNPKFFTHEWYYLQKYPPYMSFEEKLNAFSYFDEDLNYLSLPVYGGSGSTASIVGGTGATANLLSIAEDYFLSYFTRETIDGVAIPRDFKYSIFGYGTDTIFPETLFRGAKVIIKDRSEFSPIDFNIESLRFLANPKYNGYKFSSVLSYINTGTQLICIKNEKWQSITLVVLANLEDDIYTKYNIGSTAYRFVDRSLLYTVNSKISTNAGGTALQPTDINISGEIYKWDRIGNSWLVTARQDVNGNSPNFVSELVLNSEGAYNNLIVSLGSSSITFTGLKNPTSNTFECSEIIFIGLPSPSPTTLSPSIINNMELGDRNSPAPVWPYYINRPDTWTGVFFPTPLSINTISSQIIYEEGGYNGYLPIINSISFGSIANSINSGDNEIKYITVKEDGTIGLNEFCIELTRPDYPVKSTYIKPTVIKQKPVDLQASSGIIGYEITAMDRVDIHQLARYRGAYNPKWKDVVKFIDTSEIKGYTATDGNNLSYNNVQILTKIEGLPQGIEVMDSNIFSLKNLFYNKVNVESPNVILRFSESSAKSIFPLLGEVSIDKKDFFLFRSNWDTNYYNKFLKATFNVPQIGTREPSENKSFFASKVIAVPNTVRIETFPEGIIARRDLGSFSKIRTVKENIVSQVTEVNRNQILTLDVFTGLALQDWLIADGIGTQFYKYLNSDYSFGDPQPDDDIKTYISDNIYDRYVVKDIILWQKFWKKGDTLPAIEVNLTDEQKIAAGYTQTKNFQAKFANPNDLNFQLIYNIPQDRNYSIAFTIVLEKK
jgi:hypothetical protein